MRFATTSTLVLGAAVAAASVAASDAYSYRFNGEAGDVARRAVDDGAQELWARAPPASPSAASAPGTPLTPQTPGTPATPSTPTTPATPGSAKSHPLTNVLATVQQESAASNSWVQAVCYANKTGGRFLFKNGQLVHKQKMPAATLRKAGKNHKGLSLNTKAAHKHRSSHHGASTPSSASTPNSAASSAPGTPRSALTPRSAASQPATPSTAGSAPGTPVTPATPGTPATPNSAASHRSSRSSRKGRSRKNKSGKKSKPTCITWTVDPNTVKLIEQHMQAQKAAGGAHADPAAAAHH